MQTHNSCGLCRVDIKGLTVKSEGDTLLENINLELHCGQLTALIGKNGAGKTTLLRAILGERHYEGEISYFRHDDGLLKRPVIGYVPQQLVFDKSTPVSVMDFMLAAKRTRPVWLGHSASERKKVQEQLNMLDCASVVDKRLGNLSGGELQRVLLSMAVDPLPDLLILDEPSSGIDVSGLDLFYKMVSQLRDKYHMAIVLVSHDLGLIRKYADRAILLDKTVLEQGEIDDVFRSKSFINAFGLTEKEGIS